MISRKASTLITLSILIFTLACSVLGRPSAPLPDASSGVETSVPTDASTPSLTTPAKTEYNFPLLAFISGNGIFTIDEIGGKPHKIFDIPPGLAPHDLAMSPDCTQYLYTHDMGDDPEVAYQLYHFSTETQSLTQLTNPNEVDSIHDPSWSPDGKQIAFWGVGRERYKYEVHIINSDGTNLLRLPDMDIDGGACLDWSPDGTRFAYAALDDEYSIYGVMNSDGTSQKEVFRVKWTNLSAGCVTWAPDSEKIVMSVYHPEVEGNGYYKRDFAVVNSDGTDLHYITRPNSDLYSDESEPAWSPDGTSIAYSYLKDFEQNLVYIMDIEDTQRISIGTGEFGIEVQGTSPAWCSQR